MTDTTVGADTYKEVIATDLPCTQCGYNLRGLKPDGRCPECNTAIARSFHGRLLRFADPVWLRRVLLGVKLMLMSILLTIVMSTLAFLLAVAFNPYVLMWLTGVVHTGLAFAASVLVTMPEPAAVLSGSDLAVRKIVRVCATLVFVGTAISYVVTQTVWLTLLTDVLWLTGVVNHFCFCLLLRSLTDRIPHPNLRGHITVAMWGYASCMGLAAVVDAVVRLRGALGSGAGSLTSLRAMPFAYISAWVTWLGFFVFGVWYLVNLSRMHGALEKAVILARQTLAVPTMQMMTEPTVADADSEPEDSTY